ncbi:uncharacterized protein BX664DRAFT_45378 [Halteromyces radiatus]|uniref:uncharacterized protein n=1 Tax=Halteromyces radiatus TaxID=101107 RepID=UPI00221F13ED|nr:uncharacterized protein BX664DRAFT_45378 [Halteromyces radiatus]KAI8077870.1 hypothetical protein BX664DRAFT_45378 [Halteromyces radiatus]
MSIPAKLQCPICNQEFPALDQRGFRNAGYTSHHNRCIERQQQQQNESQRDHPSSRAARFALAIRRRLLPAQPPSPSLMLDGRRSSASTPLTSVSSPFSSSSSSAFTSKYENNRRRRSSTSTYHTFTPTVPSQLPVSSPQHYQQSTPRHRHTWNHWRRRKPQRRSNSNQATSSSSPSSTSPTSYSRTVRSYHSLPTMNPLSTASTFPLLTTISTADSTTALIIPQTMSPQLPVSTLPLVGSDRSPFIFTSMLTSLPLDGSLISPSSTESTSTQSNNNLNIDYISNLNNENSTTHQETMLTTPVESMMDESWWPLEHYGPSSSSSSNSNSIPQQQSFQYPVFDHLTSIGTTTILQNQHSEWQQDQPQQDQQLHMMERFNMMPDRLQSNFATSYPLDDQHQPVTYCQYCQSQNGLHEPSCSLLLYFMMNIMGGNTNDTSSSI